MIIVFVSKLNDDILLMKRGVNLSTTGWKLCVEFQSGVKQSKTTPKCGKYKWDDAFQSHSKLFLYLISSHFSKFIYCYCLFQAFRRASGAPSLSFWHNIAFFTALCVLCVVCVCAPNQRLRQRHYPQAFHS